MKGETFSEHVSRLESLRGLAPGDRIRVPLSGRTGVIVKKLGRHNGWLVRWDDPVFGVTEGRVLPSSMERA